jgi:protein-S-isoprenylcysteine O-methyltransferase Ste14
LPVPAQDTSRALFFPRLGAWLFRRRSSIPIPLALALLLVPAGTSRRPAVFFAIGLAMVLGAEALRLWAVHHIGVISRTRSDRLGPLVSTGPFALVRNPLYLGNIALWVGFAVSARILWLVPVFIVVLAGEYHAIVRWEELLLESRRGDEYRAYAARVSRWVPSIFNRQFSVESRQSAIDDRRTTFSWRDTLFSERGTLLAILLGYLLLWIKSVLWR